MGKQRLTSILHKELITKGYKFLSIKDVSPGTETTPPAFILHPIKDVTSETGNSVTSIEDGMVRSLLNSEKSYIEVYIETNEGLLP